MATASRPEQQSCFNCGAPDHWAQFCPEPRRAVPFGSVNQTNVPRPPKRKRFNAPTFIQQPIGQYGYPPQYVQQYSSGYPSAMPSAYPQTSPYGGPPTPISAYGQEPPQWPQSSTLYHGQFAAGQSHPSGPYGPVTSRTPLEQRYPSPLPAHSTYHHPSLPPPAPATLPPQSNLAGVNTSYLPRDQKLACPSNISSLQSNQGSSNSILSTSGANVQSHSTLVEPGSASGERYLQTPASRSLSNSPGAQPSPSSELDDFDLEWEEANFESAQQIQNNIVNPARALQRILPASLADMSDELKPYLMGSVQTGRQEVCLSQLIQGEAEAGFPSFKCTHYWQDRSDDPIFLRFPEEDEHIPFPGSSVPHHDHDGQRDTNDIDYEKLDYKYPGSPKPRAPKQIKYSRAALADKSQWSPVQEAALIQEEGINYDSGPQKKPRYHRSQERSASIENGKRVVQIHEHGRGEDTTYYHRRASCSQSPDYFARRNIRERQFEEAISRGGYFYEGHPFNSPEHHSPSDRRYSRSYHSRNGDSPPVYKRFRRNSHNAKHVTRRSSFSPNRGGHSGEHHNRGGKKHGRCRGGPDEDSSPIERPDHGNGFHSCQRSPSNGPENPALKTERAPPWRGPNPGNPRKRSFDHRDADDQLDEPTRQVDDVTPRLKKRQPKVAEAFSRRW